MWSPDRGMIQNTKPNHSGLHISEDATLVEHQGFGDRAQFQQPVPILVGSRQARGFQGEDGADLTHCDIADESLEVVAMGRLLS